MSIAGKKVAILATHGFEQSELTGPKDGLEQAGAEVSVVSPESGQIKGWKGGDWGDGVGVDVALDAAEAADYDALVLPGGQINPDKLRLEPKAIALIKAFADAGKPVAAICHGPWLLIDSGLAKGRKVTSWPSIKADLVNAGAQWDDKEVEVDGGVITSRKPDDVPAFTRAVIDALS